MRQPWMKNGTNLEIAELVLGFYISREGLNF
jgi:hypothetical protein